MITVTHQGNFDKTINFLNNAKKPIPNSILEKYGRIGVEALSNATPVNTGKTASSWRYEIETGRNSSSISFYNDNNNNGVNIAVILQYGHGTGTGGYVRGRDYINPAVQPVFDSIVNSVWKEVTK